MNLITLFSAIASPARFACLVLAVLPHTRHPFPTIRPALLLPIIRSLVERARARG